MSPKINKSSTFPTSETKAKSSQGLISGIASAVTGLATALIPIPGIGGIATAVGGVSSVIGSIAGVFGMDKPLSIEAPKTVKNNWMNIANGSGLEQGTMLSVDPANQVERLGPEVHYEAKYDDIAVIAQKPMLVYTAAIGAVPVGTVFLNIPVHPCLARVSGATTVDPKVVHNYSSFVANNFRHWRGSIKYHVKIFASNFHSGRIRISYEPFKYAAGAPASDRYQTIGKVIDVRGNSDCSFTVPYLSDRPFLPSSLADLRYEVERYQGFTPAPSTTDPTALYDISGMAGGLINGRLVFTLETPFAFPSSPIPNPYIAVYMACGEDIQFAEPNVDSFCNDALNLSALGVNEMLVRSADYIEANKMLTYEVPDPPPMLSSSGFDVSNPSPDEVIYSMAFEPTGDAPPSETTVEQINTFEDVAEHEITTPVQSTGDEQDVYRQSNIKDFLARPRLIYSYDWASSQPVGAGIIINPLGQYFRSAIPWSKVYGYKYFKADIEVQIRTNGTKFHYGALAYNYVPFGYNLSPTCGIDTLSGFPGGVITPDTETVHTFTMPFLFPRTAFYTDFHLRNQGITELDGPFAPNLGKVAIYALVPLAGGTVSTADVSDVHVTVFASLKNVELSGYISQELTNAPSSNMISAAVFSSLFSENTIDNLLKTEILDNPPGDEVIEAMGYTLQDVENEPCEPLAPGSGTMIPKEALHGEYVSHIKQLLCRPGFCGYINGKRNSTFVSHYGWRHNYLPNLRTEKGYPVNILQNHDDNRRTYLGNPSFLDIFRSIFLIERGSINFKFFHLLPNGTTFALGTLITHDNMSMFATAVPSANDITGVAMPMTVDQDSGSISQKFITANRYSAGSMYFPPGNQVPMEVSSPYNHPDLFHYTPSPFPGAPGNLVLPIPQQVPGVRVSLDNIPAIPGSGTVVALKSAGDDFQFSKLVPPRVVSFSFKRNLNALIGPPPF